MVWSIAESWPGVASYLDRVPLAMDTPGYRAPQFEQFNDDRVILSDGGLLAQRARRRCVAYDETLVRQARTSMLSGVLGHAFLDLCRVSDSEVAAGVVEHCVVIRDSCFDLQPMSTWRAMRRFLRICNAYDKVVGTWVLIPCIAGATFRRTDGKLGAETGDFDMSYSR